MSSSFTTIEGLLVAIKDKYGKIPWSEKWSWELIEKYIPKDYWPYFIETDGATKFAFYLNNNFTIEELSTKDARGICDKLVCWERIGNFYKNLGRFQEAILLYAVLYEKLLDAQKEKLAWVNKADPLIWMSDCYSGIRFPVISKRYLMYALCENAIQEKGQIQAANMGSYWRLILGGMFEGKINSYCKKVWDLFSENNEWGMYPEWLIQKIDDRSWMMEIPSPAEGMIYEVNSRYMLKIMEGLGKSKGIDFELLAHYLLSCMPGCKVTGRTRSGSGTDYDLICSMEGYQVDFRSEFGRYFVCECKDWERPADVTTVLKFCRVLDSIKTRFGILFSKKGVSGQGKNKSAETEIRKMYQDRGVVIIVVDENDINEIVGHNNFISMLREKYESIRLDLAPGKKKEKEEKK
jgi:hypothetical protein